MIKIFNSAVPGERLIALDDVAIRCFKMDQDEFCKKLVEAPDDKSKKDDEECTKADHTNYRSVL